MIYIANVDAWLEEVVRKCNEEGLDPLKSFFAFALFSSLDFDYISFFKEKYEQISSYSSGRNFHILTPIVYHNDIVPDEELRLLRKQFKDSGIPVGNKPCLLFFYLTASENNGYNPTFFAGFHLASFKIFELTLRDIIDVSIEFFLEVFQELYLDDTNLMPPNFAPNIASLIPKFEEKLAAPNIVKHPMTPNVDVVKAIRQKLSRGKVFISHSSDDKAFVRKLMSALANERVDAWLDEREILPGGHIRKVVTEGLKKSSALVVVLSPSSVKSEWVRFELAQFLGIDDGRRIIPILLGAKSDDLPAPFREIQDLNYIDFSNEDNWHKRVMDLRVAIEAITTPIVRSHSA